MNRAFLLLVAACAPSVSNEASPPAATGAPTSSVPAAPADASSAADAGASDASPVTPASLPCGAFPTGKVATTRADEGPSCTVFRPEALGAAGFRHPVIVWGNGTGASVSIYEAALEDWATNGFIVAAAKTSNGQGSGKALVDCLDHVMKTYAANACERAGAAGHSQGGGGAIMAGRDPRIVATAPVQPYIQQGHGGFDQGSIAGQKGTMLLLSGSNDDNAVPATHQKPVFDETNVPVFWATLVGGDHYFSAYGLSGYRDIALAWFRLQLMGDEGERAKFYGPSCAYCTNAKWTVQSKGL